MTTDNRIVFNSLDPEAEINISERNLPHWFQVGAATFVTFRTADSIPKTLPAGKSALWQVSVWNKEKTQGYKLGIKLVDSKWFVFVFDSTSLKQINLTDPEIDGNKLIAKFPMSNLPKITNSFTWFADSEFDGKWSDRIPNSGEINFN